MTTFLTILGCFTGAILAFFAIYWFILIRPIKRDLKRLYAQMEARRRQNELWLTGKTVWRDRDGWHVMRLRVYPPHRP